MAARDDIRRITRDIDRLLDDAEKPSILRQLGVFAVRMIRERTRGGKGVKRPGGNITRLKRLSRSYIKHRKQNARKLDRTTSPGKSNLTFTGQMLRSLKVRTVRKGQMVIGPSGRRNDGKTNEQVALWVQEQGRPFLFLGRAEQRKLVSFYNENFADALRKRRLT